ncbi:MULTISPECIES: DUF937 domain-containing protein [unclassified Mesorhizobium]|jgi:hypothetical protein|uniref:DUF937 domain-containing protein n=1 Tax=unclassified Mesorhizobium TaxID=325217 RepID=UPI0008EEABE0|nr:MULTISPECIES: DUF937 domain-containing protein [unclassified Mesorhizobium]RJG46342.1 DUF937 domain-containing protein [Mesorhizobium sp. DCY119]SFU00231.1 hypothetical protein SAMN05518861_109151 [Mesorhizobium sp. YR577]
MASLFDMLTNAQNGNGMDALARQFGLSPQQAQSAVAALLPAFSQGLKQNTADPYGAGAFLSAMASGQHAKYFENPAAAFSPAGMAEGNGILGHLFGSKDLSRAVAGQAAQATGIGQDVLKQMLPAIATMVMGGLFKQSTNQVQAAGLGGGSNNPLGDIIEQMMRQGGMGGAAQQQQAPQSASPSDNPLGQILEGMFGGGQAGQPQRQAQAPAGDNPLGQILEGMFGGGAQTKPTGRAQPSGQNPLGDNPLGQILEGMFGGGQAGQQPTGRAQPQGQNPLGDNPLGQILEGMFGGGAAQPSGRAQPKAQPQAAPSGQSKNPYDDLFGKMFETGAQQRDDYQKGVESIFEQFTRGMDRRR